MRINVKVVICDYEFPHVEHERKVLRQLGEIQFVPAQCKNEQELIELTKDADGVINQWSWLTEKVIANMQKCKVISTYGIGVDKIDVSAATKKGIYVCNVPDYCIHEVGDHAFAMMMALTRQLFNMDSNIRKGIWGYKHAGHDIYRIEGKVYGLVGFGKIPQTLAKKLKAFEMEVLAYDPYFDEEKGKEIGVKRADLAEIMEKADYVSIHVPLTAETRHMIGEAQLRKMKKTAYLINVGRGAIVDEAALYRALQEKWIAGAGIDVWEKEPIKTDNPFLTLDNVIITPHAAWNSQEALVDLQTKAAEEIVRVLQGREPKSPVNKPLKMSS